MGLMENNQQKQDLATIVLAEIYTDYKKEKKRAHFFQYLYYGFFAIVFAFIMALNVGKTKEPLNTDQKPFVAIIKMAGEIGPDKDISEEGFSQFIEDTFNEEKVIGVVLDIDCPGGGIYDTSILYDKILKMKAKHPEKKVTTFVRRMAGSGGYWLSVAGDKIYTTPVSQVGSIGVFIASLDLSEFFKEYKIHPYFIQAGRFKTMGSPNAPLTQEEADLIQSRVNDVHNMFINVVQTRRGSKLDNDPDLFSGLVWMGEKAVQKGLSDYCDISFEDMIIAEYGDYSSLYVEPKKPSFDIFSYLDKLIERIGVSAHAALSLQDVRKSSLIV
jgi:protease-4